MEKILTIDGRQVKFKSTGAFLLRYKSQFGHDAIQDIFKLQKVTGADGGILNIEALDLEVFYNLIWALAKTGDPNIPPPMDWLDEFDTFPLMDILPEVTDMIFSCLTSTVQSKKK